MRSVGLSSLLVSGLVGWSALMGTQVAALAVPIAPSSATASQNLAAMMRAAHFEEPLIATGAINPAEDAALEQALIAYNRRANAEDQSSLVAFLASNPHSPWASALWTNIGLSDLHNGFFSRAIHAWQTAWAQGRTATDPRARALVDRAVGELAQLYANLGKNEELTALFQDRKSVV